jgi:putative DNA methylase
MPLDPLEPRPEMSIERRFDISFVANLALREKQIQQNYRPVIAVHKWFARRPGTLFRALLLAEFGEGSLEHAFYRANDHRRKRIADPFMGGGTPLLEANRIGCDVVGFDINPMAWWIVRQELAPLDPAAYRSESLDLVTKLRKAVGSLFQTRCGCCHSLADVKYWLWVKQARCPGCAALVDLFPGYLVAEDVRHPQNVLVCPACGELNEVTDRKLPGFCRYCAVTLGVDGPAHRGRCTCPSCGSTVKFPDGETPLGHRMFAIEYHCHLCRSTHAGRFFKRPDAYDLRCYTQAAARLARTRARHIPDDEIPAGDETNRLHRWGYRRYREMFNARQLLGLELSARTIVATKDRLIREALATNLSDLLRYQNMLCRYDTMALKSLDIFSVHGFPVGLIACESNLLGITGGGGAPVGSGGWLNVIEKYARAKSYCVQPFEISHHASRKTIVPILGESIGNGGRQVELRCGTATSAQFEPESLDAVLTDPPYFGNVQYAELMDFCYVWLRQLVGRDHAAFARTSTRNVDELTGNKTLERGLPHFTDGLSAVFQRMAKALKPGAPLAFTYHHNQVSAYLPVAVGLLDARLACTAALPCPGEMGASIHISGTGSSVLDTVFVCRAAGTVPQRTLARSRDEVVSLVLADLVKLEAGGVRCSEGDVRCVVFGHVVRLAVWNLRHGWDAARHTAEKLAAVETAVVTWNPAAILAAALDARGRAQPAFGPLFELHHSPVALLPDDVSI